jgi:hypothetical protein
VALEFFVHVLGQLLERAESGDPIACAFLAVPPFCFLVLVVTVVVVVVRELCLRRKNGSRGA